MRGEIAFHGVQAVIPAQRERCNPALNDHDKCRQRSRVEQLFNKLKNWRRIATRYDKTRESYLGFVSLTASYHSVHL
jgi:transposase